MKVRSGFVSNSSSSSFVLVGIEDSEYCSRVIEKLGIDIAYIEYEDSVDDAFECSKDFKPANYGTWIHIKTGVEFVRSEEGIRVMGVDVSIFNENENKTFREIKEIIADRFEASFGIRPKSIKIVSGECSSEY